MAYLKGQENGFLPETFASWKVLALTELSQTRFEKAWRRMRSAGTHLPELAATDPALAAKWMALEGIAQRSAGHWENARAAFARALGRLQACLPRQHGDLGVIHWECAHLYWERKDFEAAAARLQQANDTFQGLQRSQFPWARIAVLASQAAVCRRQGDLRQAREKISQGRSACTGLKDLQAIQERRFALEDICLKLGIGNDRGALQQCRKRLKDAPALSAAERGEILLLQGKAGLSESACAAASFQEALQALAVPTTEEQEHLRMHALLDWAELELATSQQPAAL